MHEMGIALEIIEIATASVPEDLAGTPIARINLRIGKLSAVVPESLRFCFEVATRGTAAEGAELSIEEVPVVARCTDCDHHWTVEGPAFSCPECRSGAVHLESGQELDIVSIEISQEDDPDGV